MVEPTFKEIAIYLQDATGFADKYTYCHCTVSSVLQQLTSTDLDRLEKIQTSCIEDSKIKNVPPMPIATNYKAKNLSSFYLFLTGLVQVYFVAVNTYFIAKGMYLGVLIAAFMISIIWSFNVKKVAFGTFTDRVIYSFGATFGSLMGLWSSSFIANTLNWL